MAVEAQLDRHIKKGPVTSGCPLCTELVGKRDALKAAHCVAGGRKYADTFDEEDFA